MFRPILRAWVDQSVHAHSLYGEAVTSMMRTNLARTNVAKEKGWTFPNVYKSRPLPTEL